MAGGRDSGLHPTRSAELYDPETGVWSSTSSSGLTYVDHTATLLPSGLVLVTGGNIAELYDPATGSWSRTGNLSVVRANHTATLLPSGTVLVAGGWNPSDGRLKSAELYDPAIGSWSSTGSLGAARQFHTAALLPSGKVLVAGGFDGVNYLSSAELYDPAAGSWSSTASLNTGRRSHTATLLPSGKVLAAGGQSSSTSNLRSAELYDPGTESSPPPVTINAVSMVDPSSFILTGHADPGATVQIEATPDLTQAFTPLGAPALADAATGIFTFNDTNLAGVSIRFYRASYAP